MIPKNNKVLFLLDGLLAVIFLIIFIRILTLSDAPPIPSPTPSVTTFPVPSNNQVVPTTPPTDQTAQSGYDQEAVSRDYNRIVNREQLLENDANIRNNLLALVNNQSGILFENNNFRIEYVQSPNVFMVEIITNDAQAAKDEATGWFQDQGLSQAGICNLPVEFYLNFEVNNYYKQNNLQFNPIPNGC